MDGRLASLGITALVLLLGALPARAEGPSRHEPRASLGDPQYGAHHGNNDADDAEDVWTASPGDEDEREAPPDADEDDDERQPPPPRGEAPDLDGDDEALPTQPAASLPGGSQARPLSPPAEDTEEPAPRGPLEQPPASGPTPPQQPASAAAPL